MNFKLKSDFKAIGNQPEAIKRLTAGVKRGLKNQVLLGVTGSGKTFTMANVIEKLQRPTLVISHNKTLAGQLYQEFRDFFPKNAVSYFVSYYDYYQPEAYIPQTDTYIEKETGINEEIDKLRLVATTNLLTRRDTIVVASVSCIYNIGSPREYGHFVLELREGMKVSREQILERLIDLQYQRGNYEFKRGRFRVRGEIIDIYPAYEDRAIRLILENDILKKVNWFEPLSTELLPDTSNQTLDTIVIYPSKHYLTDPNKRTDVFSQIKQDLKERVAWFRQEGKELEAHRLETRVNYDLEMISEVGYVNGIENYSRYFDGRKPGEPPYTLLDYFNEPYGKDWLLFTDESHMTIPQLNGMYAGDRSRKETLIEFGFRLPAALDNRPLKFAEFLERIPQTVYVSATPSTWEIKRATQVVEQLVRPTGLIDPKISLRSSKGQINDLIVEIVKRVKRKERVLVTTLTKRMAEDLAEYLNKVKNEKLKMKSYNANLKNIKVAYLHSDIETLERQDILEDLRKGNYDVLVGINLLREGLDLPEVSLVAILDADKEGFLRSKISLIQTMGRAARHIKGEVIMYADEVTRSMHEAISEVNRRRKVQLEYNKKHNISPKSVTKPIRGKLVERKEEDKMAKWLYGYMVKEKASKYLLQDINPDDLTPQERKKLIAVLEKQMRQAAKELDFELAAKIRDKIREVKSG